MNRTFFANLTRAALTCVALGAYAQPALSQSGPSGDEHGIDRIVVNGSACPKGTAVDAHGVNRPGTDTLQALVFRIKAFDVAKPGNDRGFCNIAIVLKHTADWSYGVSRLATGLFADIKSGITGTVQVTSDFRGTSAKTKGRETLKGPARGVVGFAQNMNPIKYSPCGKNIPLNVKIDGWMSGKSESDQPSFFTVLPTTRAVEQVIEINWRKC